jgi:hypothetical protein
MHFTDDVAVVNRIERGINDWVLLAPIEFTFGRKRSKRTIEVPACFVTDFASIPWPLTIVAAKWGRHGRPAILHDWLYQRGEGASGPGKFLTDWVFLTSMVRLDRYILFRSRPPVVSHIWLSLSLLSRILMWLGVTLFGWIAWWRGKSPDTPVFDDKAVGSNLVPHVVPALDLTGLEDDDLKQGLAGLQSTFPAKPPRARH